MIRRDDERIVATRPDPGGDQRWPPLDVVQLARRADNERAKLRTMVEYAYYPRCRRQMVLEYFGDADWSDREKRCGACDNCDAVAHGRVTGLSEQETTAIRSLLVLVGSLNGRFGRKRIAALAIGDDTDPRFEELPERGKLRGWSEKQLMDLLRALDGAGLVEASRGEYPTISTTRKGDLAGVGRLEISDLGVQMPTVVKKKPRKRR
jgi:ATP-dependent DNA helicase RecQ